MMSVSNIFLLDPTPSARITQLYDLLELYSHGEPATNTLFVMGRPPMAVLDGEQSTELLLIDPPGDAATRFQLDGKVAVLFTGTAADVDLPVIDTQPGGVAHLRIGDHFIDVYSQTDGNVIFLPTLGILCGGSYGSDVALPALAPASDGSEELETLRLLARLLKQRPLQFYIPQQGTTCIDAMQVMERLAADVAYLHGLRRVIPKALERGDALETVEIMAESLLPRDRSSAPAAAAHERNVRLLMELLSQATAD